MTKLKTWLSALLVMQLALAIGFYWNTQNELQKNLPQPLVDIDWQALDHVVIGDATQQVALGKSGNGWVLSDHDNLPTIEGNTEQLLTKLKDLKTSWPVASTAASHARFEVTDETLQRFVAFYQGDKLLGKLIVGSSPGLRKLHVRMADADNVYAVPLELVDMITSSQSWFDKRLLTADTLKSIQGSDYKLEKQGDDWRLQSTASSGETLELDSSKVGDMVYALKDLQVRELVSELPDLSGSGYAQLAVKTGSSETPLTYQFYMTKEHCYVTRSDYDAMFTVSWSDYEKIAGMTLEKLSVQPAVDENGEGATESASQS